MDDDAVIGDGTGGFGGGAPPPKRLVYDFDGIDDYIMMPGIPVAINDTLSFVINTTDSNLNGYFLDTRDVGTFQFCLVNAGGLLQFAGCTVKVDGISKANGSSWVYSDGLDHTIEITSPLVTAVNKMLVNNSGVAGFFKGIVREIKLNDGSVYNYPINDGWAANPVIANIGSGADATAINFNEERWIEIDV